MQGAISAQTSCRFLYWTLYLSLCFISGWFASGVLDNYISRKTSFSQDEGIATKRPVISIIMFFLTGERPVINKNIWIQYCPSYKFWQSGNCGNLHLGENEFFVKEINDTEKVFLGKIGYSDFRIIPVTNLLEDKATAVIRIITLKAKFNSEMNVILTSLENSLGSKFSKFKDGDYLRYEMQKNSSKYFLIKPESYIFLPETSKCHQESYYDCLASELDRFDFSQTNCTTKCIPEMFSYGKNYSTQICQIWKDEKCVLNIFDDSRGMIENNFLIYSQA